jgi:hypothetical protein
MSKADMVPKVHCVDIELVLKRLEDCGIIPSPIELMERCVWYVLRPEWEETDNLWLVAVIGRISHFCAWTPYCLHCAQEYR